MTQTITQFSNCCWIFFWQLWSINQLIVSALVTISQNLYACKYLISYVAKTCQIWAWRGVLVSQVKRAAFTDKNKMQQWREYRSVHVCFLHECLMIANITKHQICRNKCTWAHTRHVFTFKCSIQSHGHISRAVYYVFNYQMKMKTARRPLIRPR